MVLEGSTCKLYNDKRRFKTCKNFKCKLLGQYLSNKISYDAALDIIRDVSSRRQSIRELSEPLQTASDCTIYAFIRELKKSGKMDDLSFRRNYSKQILDCLILEELLKRKFYTDKKPNRP